ncbi:LamG-like jellyroll fold domain-containing protein [Azospirillum agricola]|uniref:LamG-like jellyroll fold domain-containing protein n=1 Tax=Azospirillum agricola TaxID=1720247 RepID=UPI000A0EEF5A|nr:LamG-like jellyroll fold domain-containing protein [Azospirillum agricola]SMH29808.1 Concanavalin A-like lectin/glucanases superfamily protein [Azospirillum lipoferum]
MTVQTFNPTDLPQSTTNWAVAQRIVGPFAPHAQSAPDLTVALDRGFLLNGATLTEVAAQTVGPLALPVTGFRVDRIVIDRSTGAASMIVGSAGSATPPAIPTGTLPIARILLHADTLEITNALVYDERALSDLSPTPPDASQIPNLAEFIRDTVASFLVAGTGITLTHDDPGNTLTISTLPVDPYWRSTVLLLQPQAGDTLAFDRTGLRTLTLNGNAAITNGSLWAGYDAVTLGGSGDYVSAPDSADWNMGAEAFTIEWVGRLDTVSGTQAMLGQWTAGNLSNSAFELFTTGSNLFFDFVSGTTRTRITSPTAVSANATLYVAVTGSAAGGLTLYLNGASVGTATASGPMNNSTAPLTIGYDGQNSMDGLTYATRVTKGIARKITALSAPFPIG